MFHTFCGCIPFGIIYFINTILRPFLKHLRNGRVIKDWPSFVLTWLDRYTQASLPCAAPFFIPMLPPSELAWASSHPPHARLLTNTSLVMSFPLHSRGRYVIKKDLCCPLSSISPLNTREQTERSLLFRERTEAVVMLKKHQALKWRWLERTDRDPGLMGFIPARIPNLNWKQAQIRISSVLLVWILVKVLWNSNWSRASFSHS